MRTRTRALLVGGLLVGVVVLALAGVAMAGAWAPRGAGAYPVVSGSTPGSYGPGGMADGMMGGQCRGGMMPGGMMGGSGQLPAQQATPVTGVTRVTIQNFAFQPANIQVPAGTTVTWTNQDTAAHSVTFRDGMADSGLLRQGQSFSHTFTTAGSFDYYCSVHPYMVAHVTVTS